MFTWDGPAQLLGGEAREAIRRAQSSVAEATERLSRAAEGLSTLFSFPITRDRVTHWLDEGPADRMAAFGNTLWATISWEKSLGKPSSPCLADAFSYNHQYGWLDTAATRGEPIGNPVWETLPPPRAWDGPHDDEHYRISVLVRALPGLHNRFWPAIRNEIDWEGGVPTLSWNRRGLVWPAQMVPFGQFFLYQDDFLVLEEEYRLIEPF